MTTSKTLLAASIIALLAHASVAEAPATATLAPPKAPPQTTKDLSPPPAAPATPLPVPTAPPGAVPISPELIKHLAELHTEYELLEQRAKVVSTSGPETPETQQKISALNATISAQMEKMPLQEWRSQTMAYFLNDISKLAGSLNEPDWTGWNRAIVLAQTKEPTVAYTSPAATDANRLTGLEARSPVLELAKDVNGGWALIWVAQKGFGYAPLTSIGEIGEAQ